MLSQPELVIAESELVIINNHTPYFRSNRSILKIN